ncbi:MAG: phosphoenolpyruvate synthase, partial [Legionellaceae bacterium]|nr:phosphoenolpyruvate synthase [Legionellaceae bacterium]
MLESYVLNLEDVSLQHIAHVGGKNASLGEMIHHLSLLGVRVPSGFATTASAFRHFMEVNQLSTKIYDALHSLDVEDLTALEACGKFIRETILAAHFPQDLEEAIRVAYADLEQRTSGSALRVAVRSSATAEDLPNASFAGQQETYLNVGGIESILEAVKKVYASLFNDRAISYRVHQNFAHEDVAISVGIQQMVRSDIGTSGVLFTVDTESGFEDVILITAAYGLGEMVVQGSVNPDEYYVYKPALRLKKSAIIRRHLGSKAQKMIYATESQGLDTLKIVSVESVASNQFALTDQDITELSEIALVIEQHYGRAMDIEWAKDGETGLLYIVQARPETVQSQRNAQSLERFELTQKGKVLIEGRSIGQRIGQGKARVIRSPQDMHALLPGEVLVADMTDPDWEPVMKRASAIVTNRGGRTCHAAIIARELGIPAVVGCGKATQSIPEGSEVTVSCSEGDTGYVYDGLLTYEHKTLDVHNMPDLPTKVMLNVGNPERAFAFRGLPNAGVGLARLEFIISNYIGVHPKALLFFRELTDETLKSAIAEKIAAYGDPIRYYIERLKEGVATIAAAFYPKPVIVRLSDFKSNEYAHLLGGEMYEPTEENPMLGFRGASRYVDPNFEDCFALECQALRAVRQDMGLDNVQVMVPFVRTVSEAALVIEALARHGLRRGEAGLKLIMMCEIPSNALLADQFLTYFDGFSIGSNDLTQLTLGLDRDSGL